MKKIFLCSLGRMALVILALLISGCAAVPPKPTPEKAPEKAPEKPPERVPEKEPVKVPEKDPFSIFPERYRQQAAVYERNGELPKALQCWEIVNAFQPADEEAIRKKASLKMQIQTLSGEHFAKGLSYYQSHSVAAARKEFLLALYYNPEHAEALSYLKNKLIEEDYVLYEVKPGDTLRDVARKVYNDPKNDFLIAYFNNLGKNAELVPGTSLRLPLLDTPQAVPQAKPEPYAEPVSRPTEAQGMMAKAMAYFKTNKFKETLSITEEILLTDPSNKEARDLSNASYYQIGRTLQQQKNYKEALDQFEHVDPNYRDVSTWVASARRQLAEVHYVTGIKYFTQEKLDKAIEEWEETLRLNPQHPKAKGDMENAARLLQKLNEIK